MNDEMTLEDHGLDHETVKARDDDGGIEVDEPIEFERIELADGKQKVSQRLGWEIVSAEEGELPALLEDEEALAGAAEGDPGDSGEDSRSLAERLEAEHLQLAAELTQLRADAASQEQALEEEIGSLREKLADREAELSDQVAQIASLTLTCDGLRSRLTDEVRESSRVGWNTAAPAARPATDGAEMIASLKARLEERGHALTVAREEIENLRAERAKLADALAERGEQVAQLLGQVTRAEVRQSFGMDFRSSLRRLLRRNPETGTRIAQVDWQPDSENEPTIAVEDSGPAAPSSGRRTAGRGGAREQAVARAVLEARKRSRGRAPAVERFLISLEPEQSEVFDLKKPRCYVGRGAEADVRITDETVSRLHAVVYLLGGATMVEDVCSTNGVFVNRERVKEAVLKDGDTVAFGSARFQFRVGSAPSKDG